jgi:hypothetical protein
LKKVYNLPVDSLLVDFTGQSLEEYIRTIFGSGEVNESITVIQDMITSILSEQLDEIATMGSSTVEGGSSPLQGKRSREDEEEDVSEATFHPSELPQQGGLSSMSVTVTSNSRHESNGGSDAVTKKSIKNKFKIDSRYTDKRAPYYDEGDIITDLVEKVLHNIIRLN